MGEAEFDRFADEYHREHAASIRLSGERPEYFHCYKVADVASRLGSSPRKILDFGGGVGNSLGPMRTLFPESEIVLLDPSSRSLDIARGRHAGAATFQQFDGRTVPFPNEMFDLVFAACVFHHIDEALHQPLLAEIARVLEPRGSLFVFEHNPLNPLTRRAVRDCPFDENAVLIRAAEMRRRVEAAGLDRARIVYRIFFPHLLRHLRGMERILGKLPLGAQYFVHANKPAP